MQGGEERRELLLAASAKATMMTAMTMTMMTTMMTTTTTTLLSSVGGPSLFQQRDHVHIQALTAAAALDQGGWQTCWEGQPAICHRHPNWWRFVVTVMIHVMEGGGGRSSAGCRESYYGTQTYVCVWCIQVQRT